MKRKILSLSLGFIFAIALSVNSKVKSEKLTLIEDVSTMAVVRMPVAELCPSLTKYQTKCMGEGAGCDLVDCNASSISPTLH